MREQNKYNMSSCAVYQSIAYVQTSPISFVVPFPRATKEIGDVCTQAIKARLLPKNPISFFVEEQSLYCFIVSVKEKASLLFGRKINRP